MLYPKNLKNRFFGLSKALGFDELSVSEPDLREASAHLKAWIAAGHHGEMAFMNTHQALRAEPGALHPGTVATALSAPFAATGVEVHSPAAAAGHLLECTASVTGGSKPLSLWA